MSDSNVELSEMTTDQRNEETCAYFALSKVILQNIIQLLYPIQVDASLFKKNTCSRFLDRDSFLLFSTDLTPEKCSPGGYTKIWLFRYLFYTIFDIRNPGLSLTSTKPEQTSFFEMLGKVFMRIYRLEFPRYFSQMLSKERTLLTPILQVMSEKFHQVGFQLFTLQLPKNDMQLALHAIKMSVQRGFYVGVTYKKDEDTAHVMHIVSVQANKLVIKNSWGSEIPIIANINDTIDLYSDGSRYEISFLSFLLPKITGTGIDVNLETGIFGLPKVLNILNDPSFHFRVNDKKYVTSKPYGVKEPPKRYRIRAKTYFLRETTKRRESRKKEKKEKKKKEK